MSTPLDPGSPGAPPPSASRCPACGAATGGGPFCIDCGEALFQSRVGKVLAGRYRVDSLIGQGGFGRVYRGTHLALESSVAIKFLHDEYVKDAELRARLKREAFALAHLHHPAIVTVHDYGEEEGAPYLVMELLSGIPLERLVCVDGKTLPRPRIGAIVDQVLEVLEVAHGAGVVHRDLKPSNIILLDGPRGGERIKVVDFGIALVRDVPGPRLTDSNEVRGTPSYMSPEQCRGRNVGPPSDIYSVGVLLYELLTGETPFGNASPAEILAQHMYVKVPPMRERGVLPAVPEALETLARWALSKDPKQRPTAMKFRIALAEALRGTDAISVAARGSDERLATAALSREERALPRPDAPEVRTVRASGEEKLVVLWGFPPGRSTELRDALAVSRIVGAIWQNDPPPPDTVFGQKVLAVVVPGAKAGERVRAVRAGALAALPVVVVDVASADETPTLIRAGASDVALTAVGDETVCEKVWRALRRGR